jgi:outer membrane lipoprotein SlyB
MKSRTRLLSIVSAITVATGLTACAGDPYGPNNYPVSGVTPVTTTTYPVQTVSSVEFGRITNVSLVSGTPIAGAPSARTGVGTVLGAIVGGALGSQIGGGSGRTAATVLGAVGGAVAGNRIAQNTAPTYAPSAAVYRVSVQTDQGALRTYDVSANSDLRVGDRVRIENGVIYLG